MTVHAHDLRPRLVRLLIPPSPNLDGHPCVPVWHTLASKNASHQLNAAQHRCIFHPTPAEFGTDPRQAHQTKSFNWPTSHRGRLGGERGEVVGNGESVRTGGGRGGAVNLAKPSCLPEQRRPQIDRRAWQNFFGGTSHTIGPIELKDHALP